MPEHKPQPGKNNTQQIKKLIELNDELENYFRNTIIPQLFVDADLILRKFTPPAMQQFSLEESHIGRPMDEVVDNIRYSTIIENIHEVISSGEILEKEIQTTDKRWFQMNIIPYHIKRENRTNGVIITFVDITDRIKVLRELELLNASHETFIYSVSHDLRSPLANIEGLVKQVIKSSEKLIKTSGADSTQHNHIVEMLDDSIKGMRNIIDELSEIVKIQTNYKEVGEHLKFDMILKEVELTLKDKIISTNAAISYDIQENNVKFSRKNLRSILYNLLSNAIKYKHPVRNPEIQIKTLILNGVFQLSVSDNGRGISEDKLGMIFTPFTRLSTDVEGTGIGLHLVKKIIENSGGSIFINSKVDEGTAFVVRLPLES
jgi:two-component system phosphate regulon sensor histidine kinase PhoR